MLRKSKERIEKEDELVTEKPNSLRRSERLSNKQSNIMKSESHYNVHKKQRCHASPSPFGKRKKISSNSKESRSVRSCAHRRRD